MAKVCCLPAFARSTDVSSAAMPCRCAMQQGHEIARGLVAYNASDAEHIAGKRSVEIEAILGYRGRDEMIHRDDLALTGNVSRS